MRIHHIAISSKNAERSAEFYMKHFGFKHIRDFTKPRWDGKAKILELEGTQLEIFEFNANIDKKDNFSDLKVIGLKHIGIQVDSVQDTYKKIKTNDSIDIDEPVKGTTCAWFCFVRDPDGLPIELYEANK